MPDTPSPVDLVALSALLARATPGPWRDDQSDPSDVVVYGPREEGDERFLMNVGGDNPSEVGVVFDADSANAALIVALRNAAPAMLASLASLRAAESALDDIGVVRSPAPAVDQCTARDTPEKYPRLTLVERVRDLAKGESDAMDRLLRADQEIASLRADNARLREALAFYADVDAQGEPNRFSDSNYTGDPSDVEYDRGTKARTALGAKGAM